MKVLFMGTPEFAVASLAAIHKSSHEIVGVVTSTDKPAGRGKKIQSSAVKKYAVENGLKLLQPNNLKENSFIEELKALKADVFVVVAFRMLPKSVWSIPSNGTFNLHASLLPQYRGAAPINWAIINGEKKSGITTFLIDDKIDTGEILLQEEVIINEGDNAGILHDCLMNLGAKLILKTINDLKSIKPAKQTSTKENLNTAYKLNKSNTRINWENSSKSIKQLILGLSPYPAAWTQILFNDKKMLFKIFDAEISSKNLSPGATELSNNLLHVGTANGSLLLKEVQLEGKKRMPINAFINGTKNLETSKFI